MEYYILVKKSKQGDGNAFSKLIKLFEKDLYRVAIAMLKNNDDALDCIQETILSAYKSIKGLAQAEYFKTWLIKILINKCNDALKKKSKTIPYSEIPAVAEGYQSTDKFEVRDAVDHLEDELKVLVVLYYFQDISIGDIAAALRIPEGTVKSRLSRARSRLKELLNYSEKGVI